MHRTAKHTNADGCVCVYICEYSSVFGFVGLNNSIIHHIQKLDRMLNVVCRQRAKQCILHDAVINYTHAVNRANLVNLDGTDT